MSALSNYLENALINAVLRNSAYSSPATVYVALATSDPGEAATGGSMNEVANSGSYARVAVTFGAPSNGAATNSGAVTFTTATGNWGTVTHFALVDSGTHGAGNVLFYGALAASKTVASGDSISFADGQISASLA